MKLIYAMVLVLMVFVSACAQQTQPVAQPAPQPPAQPETQPAPVPSEEPVEETEVVEGETVSSAGDIRILGKEGFEPSQMQVSAGDAVTWINDDQKALTLTIFKDGKWYLNSDVIESGGQFEREFTETGTYEYWTIAYGPTGAAVVVE